MRATWLAALSVGFAGPAACTFPTVDYAIDSGTGGGASCPAPPGCATDAMTCANNANNKHTACTHACHTDTACIAQCDAAQTSELTACAGDCESCVGSSCGGAATNCAAIVGL